MKHITVNLDDGYEAIVDSVEEYERRLTEKTNMIVSRLAQMGARTAGMYFKVPYDGEGDVSVTWEPRGDGVAAVVASGSIVLFLEFGAGYLMGSGHPEPMGYGPGTYNPTSNNWKNPNGWYYKRDTKSYGNPPAAAMYQARKELEQNLVDLVKGFLE